MKKKLWSNNLKALAKSIKKMFALIMKQLSFVSTFPTEFVTNRQKIESDIKMIIDIHGRRYL